jgi:hypothetical protein
MMTGMLDDTTWDVKQKIPFFVGANLVAFLIVMGIPAGWLWWALCAVYSIAAGIVAARAEM